MKTNHRKVLLINRPFQISFLFYTLGIAAAITLIYFLSISYFFWKFESEGFALGLSTNHPFFKFIDQQRAFMNMVFLVTSICVAVVLLLSGLVLSNRIAGPLYNLNKYLNSLNSGEASPELKFREKDYFKELAESVNNCLKRLGQQK